MSVFRVGDWVKIDASVLSGALVDQLGRGRTAEYTGRVVEAPASNRERVRVAVDGGDTLWFDADVLSANPQFSIL
ncbi:MAG: hypothetical protein IPK79_00130 [Vampirovibrionales bacterium]|nr:hypothetical protein [Vampirovibrionales bacterium]